MNDTLILWAVFTAVLLLAFTLLMIVSRSRDIRRNIDQAVMEASGSDPVNELFATDNEDVGYYFEVQRKYAPGSLPMRLITAGYFHRQGPKLFNLLRFTATALTFFGTWYLVITFAHSATTLIAFLMATLIAGLVFILVNFFLDRQIRKNETINRRLFPDFMDLLIVCVDAGLSIEAAIDRVAREFTLTKPAFGKNLAIISLEVRAGRPMFEALANFADRVHVEEARTLATLFRQSQELGSSVVKTLRVFSKEMRQMRLIRAEEKANALPVKMLFPLAAFLFPVNLVIVLVPVMIEILQMFTSLRPGG